MISVVIPTKNESGNIKSLLNSIPPRVELVIVDSGEDDIEETLKSERGINFTFIRRDVNIALARQIGSEICRGSIIVFTDADVFFCDGYFEKLPAFFESYDAVYGSKYSHKKMFPLYYRLFYAGQRFFNAIGIPAASGSNMACRREVFEKVGFDTSLPCNEDTEFFFRAKHEGFRVGFVDLPVFSFDERRLKRGIVKKLLHNIVRNFLLFLNLYLKLPRRILESDWGYWD